MEDQITRIVEDLAGRIEGPMSFRLVVQPVMAVIFAILDGRKDALEGRAPYFWALFADPRHRSNMVRDGWRSVGKIFIVAIVLDATYQYVVLRWFYPGEALVVAFVLALLPYSLLRGPVNRLLFRKARG